VQHTHLKMTGLWHRYERGEPWRRHRDLAVAVLVAGPFEAVCFHAPVARLVEARRIERELRLPLRGLDLVRDDVDFDRVLAGLRALAPQTPLGVALLEQGVVAGIGNVYKSEVCFRARLSPALPLVAVSDDALRTLLHDTARVMRANVAVPSAVVVDGSPAVAHYRYERTTQTTRAGCERGKGPIAVYGRAGEPCVVCGTAIAMFRQGPLQRSSYACPRCQPLPVVDEARSDVIVPSSPRRAAGPASGATETPRVAPTSARPRGSRPG
jgi:endonuclease-8